MFHPEPGRRPRVLSPPTSLPNHLRRTSTDDVSLRPCGAVHNHDGAEMERALDLRCVRRVRSLRSAQSLSSSPVQARATFSPPPASLFAKVDRANSRRQDLVDLTPSLPTGSDASANATSSIEASSNSLTSSHQPALSATMSSTPLSPPPTSITSTSPAGSSSTVQLPTSPSSSSSSGLSSRDPPTTTSDPTFSAETAPPTSSSGSSTFDDLTVSGPTSSSTSSSSPASISSFSSNSSSFNPPLPSSTPDQCAFFLITSDSLPGSTSSIVCVSANLTSSIPTSTPVPSVTVVTSEHTHIVFSPYTKTISSTSTIFETGVLGTDTPNGPNQFARNTGAVIGVALAGTVFLIAAVFIIFFLCRNYKARRSRSQHGSSLHHLNNSHEGSWRPPLDDEDAAINTGDEPYGSSRYAGLASAMQPRLSVSPGPYQSRAQSQSLSRVGVNDPTADAVDNSDTPGTTAPTTANVSAAASQDNILVGGGLHRRSTSHSYMPGFGQAAETMADDDKMSPPLSRYPSGSGIGTAQIPRNPSTTSDAGIIWFGSTTTRDPQQQQSSQQASGASSPTLPGSQPQGQGYSSVHGSRSAVSLQAGSSSHDGGASASSGHGLLGPSGSSGDILSKKKAARISDTPPTSYLFSKKSHTRRPSASDHSDRSSSSTSSSTPPAVGAEDGVVKGILARFRRTSRSMIPDVFVHSASSKESLASRGSKSTPQRRDSYHYGSITSSSLGKSPTPPSQAHIPSYLPAPQMTEFGQMQPVSSTSWMPQSLAPDTTLGQFSPMHPGIPPWMPSALRPSTPGSSSQHPPPPPLDGPRMSAGSFGDTDSASDFRIMEGLLHPRLMLKLTDSNHSSSASLRDNVDYSRPIGGVINNRLHSTTTFNTQDTPDTASQGTADNGTQEDVGGSADMHHPPHQPSPLHLHHPIHQDSQRSQNHQQRSASQ
ncbi:hypothetical protein BDN72DRAFT_616259 [Pluteus cervinus]|uniref:Uncharacterized protein n=1 Tax=Pluteus cervinus TaxID=181527 RepID=A0ACD3ATS4_9AGAR|nr:hypothetical protein BDN72DRAFT_616259 [Pluteus cervinus]